MTTVHVSENVEGGIGVGKHKGAIFSAAAAVQNAATECLSNQFDWFYAQVYLLSY